MPKRILIIGLLGCLCGALAIWDIVSGLMRSHLNLNFSVFLLPVGIGLMRGKASSLWWAKFWVYLGYLICGLAFVAVALDPRGAKAEWMGREIMGVQATFSVIAVIVMVLLLLTGVLVVLRSAKATAYCSGLSRKSG